MRTPDGPPGGGPRPFANPDPVAADPVSAAWHVVYTRPLQERTAAGALIDAGIRDVVVPTHLSTLRQDPTDLQGALLFSSYVFFRATFNGAVRAVIERCHSICYVVGPRRDTASVVEESDMNLVRELMHSERFPLLGEAPSHGRMARVISGPLAGIEGVVIMRTAREARIATRIQLVGEVCEITVPLDSITLLSVEDTRFTIKTRHRGGARARRRTASALRQIG
ncbi:MAG: transcription termination/antitermination NusG family protein [Candidatus Sumerlaeota bacterium]